MVPMFYFARIVLNLLRLWRWKGENKVGSFTTRLFLCIVLQREGRGGGVEQRPACPAGSHIHAQAALVSLWIPRSWHQRRAGH